MSCLFFVGFALCILVGLLVHIILHLGSFKERNVDMD